LAQKKYNVVSLFSGGMGLDIGLEMTGRFRLKACVEKEPAFCETIRRNWKAKRLPAKLRIFERDITDLDPEEVLKAIGLKPGELDVLVGGPPCQSFSTAGRRGSIQDPRGTLIWHFLRFVSVMKPRFFLMENVRGLLSAAVKHRPITDRPEKGGASLRPEEEPGSVVRLFADDLRELEDVSYHLDVFEVNSVNYGAPQIRERVLMIGNRYGAEVNFPDPTHVSPDETEADLFSGVESKKPWGTLRNAIGDLQEESPIIMDFSPRKKHFLSQVPPGSNWRSLPEDVQKESMGRAWAAKGGRSGWWRRLTLDLPSPTLVTMPNHASTSLCHPTETRALTLREYARIQEFPDDWELAGKTSEQYAQVGNAVPTRLGRVAGDVLAGALDVLRDMEWEPYSETPPDYRVIYVKSHVRTRKWFSKGITKVWRDGEDSSDASHAAMKTTRRARSMKR
jgi:DNA (cytosine-5)-methyltransferase 1